MRKNVLNGTKKCSQKNVYKSKQKMLQKEQKMFANENRVQ